MPKLSNEILKKLGSSLRDHFEAVMKKEPIDPAINDAMQQLAFLDAVQKR